MKEIARGAESVIYEDGDKIIKLRLKKSYRISKLDDGLRKQRTEKEASLLSKVPIAHPKLIDTDNKEKIVMERIKGVQLKEALDKNPALAKTVGEMTAKLHSADIIHGDLTTSNIMLNKEEQLVFIDFGLAFHSTRVEDKAVDIHLFKQALNSKHHKVFDKALKEFFKGYASVKEHDEIMKRFKEVELRGRYRRG